MEDFLRYEFGGLIFGGAYFWNFTVCCRLINFAIHGMLEPYLE